jgi:hypothetical protein
MNKAENFRILRTMAKVRCVYQPKHPSDGATAVYEAETPTSGQAFSLRSDHTYGFVSRGFLASQPTSGWERVLTPPERRNSKPGSGCAALDFKFQARPERKEFLTSCDFPGTAGVR